MTVSPIRDEELPALFDPAFRGASSIVLAVSGGADSMALLVLADRWRKRPGQTFAAPPMFAVTVDHGLRVESAGEAAWVAAQAGGLGIAHSTLRWDGDKPATGLQDAARQARYGLLAAFAAHSATAAGPALVVTAHTQDDQAETLLMRLARGSGIDGLAAMPPRRSMAGFPSVELVRPMLGIAKARLIASLNATARAWIEDPSNEQGRFERVRLRRQSSALADAGLVNDKLALSAHRLMRARDALRHVVIAREAALVDYHGGAFAEVSASVFAAEPEEIRLRLLARIVIRMGGELAPPAMEQLEDLIGKLAGGPESGRTLAGCVVRLDVDRLQVCREPGRRGLPTLLLQPGETAIWDKRFQVGASAACAGPLTIKALPAEVLADVKHRNLGSRRIPHGIALTLPSAWSGETLVGAPFLPDAEPADAPRLFTATFVERDDL